MKSDTLTYEKNGVHYTIDSFGNLLQEYSPQTGITIKYLSDGKEVYYPHLKLMDRYKFNRYGDYTLDYSTFYDEALIGLKLWYNVDEVPSSYAVGEIVTNSEYSKMKFSQRKPIVDMYQHKVEKFVSRWRAGELYDISILVSKIDTQNKTTQISFVDKVAKMLPVLK